MTKTKAEKPAPLSFVLNKTEHGLIRVQISEFKGKMFLDIRNFYKDRTDGTFKPTQKGVAVPLEFSAKFASRLPKILANAAAAGHKIKQDD